MEIEFNLAVYADGADLHGKRLMPREPPGGFGKVRFRSAAGLPHVLSKPLNSYPALFLEFAALKKCPVAIQQFVNTYGTIGLASQFLDAELYPRAVHEFLPKTEWEDDEFSNVENWYPEIDEMSDDVAAWQIGGFPTQFAPAYVTLLARGTVCHRCDEDSSVHLIFFPDKLLDALWLQFYEAVSSGASFKECKHCDKSFRYGRGTGKRSSAKFCTPKCKQVFFNAKRNEVSS